MQLGMALVPCSSSLVHDLIVVVLVHDMSEVVPVSCTVSMHLQSITACRKVVSTPSAALEVFATSKNLKATLCPWTAESSPMSKPSRVLSSQVLGNLQ